MGDARKAPRVCSRARVVGVAFFDYNHGQTTGAERDRVAPGARVRLPLLREGQVARQPRGRPDASHDPARFQAAMRIGRPPRSATPILSRTSV
jgi:hypothetical protein